MIGFDGGGTHGADVTIRDAYYIGRGGALTYEVMDGRANRS